MNKLFLLFMVSSIIFSSVTQASDFDYVSVDNGSILTYEETEVLCETVLNLNSGKRTLGFLKKYSQMIPSKSTHYFLREYGTSMNCYTVPFVHFVLYRGHPDDVQALFDAGFNPNWVIEDNQRRRMTMLDYIKIVYKDENRSSMKDVIKLKMRTIQKAGGRTCARLKNEFCNI